MTNNIHYNTYLFLFASLLIIAFFPIKTSGEIIKMRSSGEIEGNLTRMQNGQLFLKDRRVIEKDDVKEIIFTNKKAKENKKTKISQMDKEHAKKLFQEAATFRRKYSEAGALILRDHCKYHLKSDGTWIFRQHFCVQVLKKSMTQKWGVVAESFEEGRSLVRIIMARTYLPDGTILPLEKDNIVISQIWTGKFDFHNYKTMRYALPHVEVGSIIESIVEIETYNPFRKDFFFPVCVFQLHQPVKSSVLKIIVPKERQLYYHTKNFSPKYSQYEEPDIRINNAQKEYIWEMTDIPPIIAEPSMNHLFDIALHLRVSIFEDWDRIFEWLKAMYKERTVARPDLTRFTLDLVKDCSSDEDKVAGIYHYLQKNIRYLSVKRGIASTYGGYDANLTWERGYGCCIDKALLFTAMLNVIGIESTPVLLNTNGYHDYTYEIPHINFVHAITLVKLEGDHTENPDAEDATQPTNRGKRLFLDCSGSGYRYPYSRGINHGVRCLNVFDEKIEFIPIPSPGDNSSSYMFSIKVRPDGNALVEFSAVYTGSAEASTRRFGEDKVIEQKQVLQAYINGISPGSQLKEYRLHNPDDISKPFRLTLKYDLKDYFIQAGELIIMNLPGHKREFGEVALEKRKYPIEYITFLEEIHCYNIHLPENFQIEYMLEEIEMNNKHGSFKVVRQIKGNSLVLRVSFRRFSRLIPAEDYADYKIFLERVTSYIREPLVLKRISSDKLVSCSTFGNQTQ